jgi:hypothetical protein
MKKIILLAVTFVLVSCSKTYVVFIDANVGGSVSTMGGEYKEGDKVSVTAIPDTEYEFQQWSDGSKQNPRTISVNASISITAQFVKKQYEVTVTKIGMGSIKEDIVLRGDKQSSGTQMRYTATPQSGWVFGYWKVNDVFEDFNPIVVTINKNTTVVAVFEREEYDLDITVEGEGVVNEEILVQPSQYQYQTQVKLTAVPANGWEFESWTGAINSTQNPVSLFIDSNKSVTAKFKRKKYSLSISVIGEGDVNETIITSPGQYDYQTQLKLTANPKNGWKFESWSGDFISQQNPLVLTLDSDISLEVTFSESDSDGDGVFDLFDKCPDTPFGIAVNSDGCSPEQEDNNGNGIPDSLEGDSDGDGVIDYYDQCPSTGSGQAVNEQGCSVEDKVYLDSRAVSGTLVENFVTGTISFSIRNDLDDQIRLEALRIFDGRTGALRAVGDRINNPSLFPDLAPGQSQALQTTFNSPIYLPIYEWTFIYKGQAFSVSKQWTFYSTQSRPSRRSLKEDKNVLGSIKIEGFIISSN